MAKKESKALVTYDNKLNMIALKGMSQVENDVFFALLYKLKNQGTNEIRLDFSELKQLINFNQNSEFIRKSILGIAEKIARSVLKYETEETTKFFTLFQILEIPNKGDYYIKAKISEPFEYMLNNLKQGFTAFEIAEFSGLASKYSQTLYRLLKQFKLTGFLTMKWDQFIEIMDIPSKMAMCDIDKDIIKPAIKELQAPQTLFNTKSQPFKKLSYKKTKTSGQGNKITGIEFYFLPEINNEKELSRAEKSLQTISTDLKREQDLKQIKREIRAEKVKKDTQAVQKQENFNPMLGKVVDWTETYLNRHFYSKSDFGGYDTCKILSIEPRKDIYFMTAKNQENNTQFFKEFGTKEHFENWFNKVQ